MSDYSDRMPYPYVCVPQAECASLADATNPDLPEIRDALQMEFKPLFPELQDSAADVVVRAGSFYEGYREAMCDAVKICRGIQRQLDDDHEPEHACGAYDCIRALERSGGASKRADAEKDAARYLWLLSNYARVDVMESASRIGLDKTIDAAMLAEKKEPT